MNARAHGGPRPGELESQGWRAEDVLDFSVNINPYGPTPDVAAAVRAAPLLSYPDAEARGARTALAELWKVPAAQVALGNGAAELLWALARLLVSPGGVLLMAGPTFSEMAIAARQNQARVVEVTARAETDFAMDAELLSRALARTGAQAAYLCTPNNPNGLVVDPGTLARLAARHPAVTFVVDQAFLSLSEHHLELAASRPANAVFVRSLTKDHALAGLRLGAVIASPDLIAALDGARPSWSTGSLVQAAAVAAASPPAQAFVATTRARMLDDRRNLQAALQTRGFKTYPTHATFFLVDVGSDANAVRTRLLHDHRILVRDCSSFGLPTLIRLGARPPADQAHLLRAWDIACPRPG